MLEKDTILILIFFTQSRRMNDLFNPFWIVAVALFYCVLASLCGRDSVRHLLKGYFFEKAGCFLNSVALNVSVALNMWSICSHPETQALKQAKQQLPLLKCLFATITVSQCCHHPAPKDNTQTLVSGQCLTFFLSCLNLAKYKAINNFFAHSGACG